MKQRVAEVKMEDRKQGTPKDQQPKQQHQRQRHQQKPQKQKGQPQKQSFSRLRRAPPGVEVSHCIKYTIFFLNVVFWFLGVFMLGFGIWGVVSKALVSVEAIAEVRTVLKK